MAGGDPLCSIMTVLRSVATVPGVSVRATVDVDVDTSAAAFPTSSHGPRAIRVVILFDPGLLLMSVLALS